MAQQRPLSRLINPVPGAKLRQLPGEIVDAVRRAPVLHQPRLELDQHSLAVDEAPRHRGSAA